MSLNNDEKRTWACVDGILVINLDRDTERLSGWQSEVGERLPVERTCRISAVDGRELADYGMPPWFSEKTGERAGFWGGSAGCVLSHRRAIEKARDAGWKRVLIMEDDSRFADATGAERLACVWSLLKGEYLLYLGCHEPEPYGKCVDATVGLWEIDGALATHAYVLTSGLYEPILNDLPTEENVWDWIGRNKAVDLYYRNHISRKKGAHVYALLPPLICQGLLSSSIFGDTYRRASACIPVLPKSRNSIRGIIHGLLSLLRRFCNYLDSLRTHRRALRKGLPGYRKPRR